MKLARLLLFAFLAVAPWALAARTGQNEIVTLLLDQDYGALEQTLAAAQQKFEDGELTEFELRDVFEPFTTLKEPRALANLRDWAGRSPRSYVANLALGMNYRALGSAARGTKFWDQTTTRQRDGFVRNFTLAEPALRRSITLTSRPYLSALNLLTIAGNAGNRPFLDAALLVADDALPGNLLAKANYARYLLPRWGGSYAQFEAFVTTLREHGVDEDTLRKLQAMELNDRGMDALARHDDAGAASWFAQALQRARESGDAGGFPDAWLAASVRHLCKDASVAVCEPPVSGVGAAAAVAPSTSRGHLGDDIEHPVVVLAHDPSEGVRTEYAFVALCYPDAKRTSQALIPRAGRQVDMLAITTADGRDLRLYFDITAFFDPARSKPGGE